MYKIRHHIWFLFLTVGCVLISLKKRFRILLLLSSLISIRAFNNAVQITIMYIYI